LAPNDRRLEVVKRLGNVTMQSGTRISGLSPPIHFHPINTRTILGMERGVKERVLYVPRKNGSFEPAPIPSRSVFEAALLESVVVLKRSLPSTAPMSYQKFIDTTTGRKRAAVRDIVAGLLVKSLTTKDSEVSIFTKYEKTNFTKKRNPAPRIISYRGGRFCAEFGRYIRPIEHHILHKSIRQLFGETTVFKGMNALDMGRQLYAKWCKYQRPVAIGIDAVKYDQHMHVHALRLANSVYADCFPCKAHKSKFLQLATQLYSNKCKGYAMDGKLKYQVDGQTMSGEMSTSLTACLIMCLMVHAFAKSRGVCISLANNGDDCVIIMEDRDLHKFQNGFDRWFHDVGFEMTVEDPVRVFEQISFCQTQPIFVGPEHDDYIMCRDPFVGIAKDTVMIDRWKTPKFFRAWLNAVGQGGLALTGGIPIFQSFYEMYIRNGEMVEFKGTQLDWMRRQSLKVLKRKSQSILSDTRVSFYNAFGVLPEEQVVLESFYSEFSIASNLETDFTKFRFQSPMPLGVLDPGPCPWESYVDRYGTLSHDRMVVGMVITERNKR